MAQFVDSIWDVVGRIDSRWTIIVLLAAFLIFWLGFFRKNVKSYLPARTFDGRTEGFWPSQVESILKEFNPTQLQTYLNQARGIDMVFPLIYSILAAVIIHHAAPYLTMRWLILLPFGAALADYVENISVITLIGRFRAGAKFGVWPVILVIAQRAKFLLLGASLVIVLILTIGWTRRRLA